MSDGMSQEKKVLNYMKKNGTITSYEAFLHLGITRLSARIADLRSHGYNVITTMSGDARNYAIYSLGEE